MEKHVYVLFWLAAVVLNHFTEHANDGGIRGVLHLVGAVLLAVGIAIALAVWFI